jgi:hypothetical protein
MCGRALRCKGKTGEASRVVQSCVRPVSAVLMTAGLDEVRGSGGDRLCCRDRVCGAAGHQRQGDPRGLVGQCDGDHLRSLALEQRAAQTSPGLFYEPFLMIDADLDTGLFCVEGPMTDARPWRRAVQRAKEKQSRHISSGPTAPNRDALARDFQRTTSPPASCPAAS